MLEEVPEQGREPSPDLLAVAGSLELSEGVPDQARGPSPDLLATVAEGSPDLLADQSLDDLDAPPELPAAFTPGRSVCVWLVSSNALSFTLSGQ